MGFAKNTEAMTSDAIRDSYNQITETRLNLIDSAVIALKETRAKLDALLAEERALSHWLTKLADKKVDEQPDEQPEAVTHQSFEAKFLDELAMERYECNHTV